MKQSLEHDMREAVIKPRDYEYAEFRRGYNAALKLLIAAKE